MTWFCHSLKNYTIFCKVLFFSTVFSFSLQNMGWTWLSSLYEFVITGWTWIQPLFEWLPVLTGGSSPVAVVEGDGVVNARETTGMKIKRHTVKIERDSDTGKCSSENAGPAPQVKYYARDNGVILADKHSDGTVDVMEFIVSQKKKS